VLAAREQAGVTTRLPFGFTLRPFQGQPKAGQIQGFAHAESPENQVFH